MDEAAGTKEGAPQGAEPRKMTEAKKEGALAMPAATEPGSGSSIFTAEFMNFPLPLPARCRGLGKR